MVELIRTVRRYGIDRLHIEVPKEYRGSMPEGSEVVVIDKVTYDKLCSTR